METYKAETRRFQNLIDQQPEVKKRGVKANKDYLRIAIDNLENQYIAYFRTPRAKTLSLKAKQERVKKRNEISALESRIMQKLNMFSSQFTSNSMNDKVAELCGLLEEEIDQET